MKKELLLLLASKLRENAANPTGMKFSIHAWYRHGIDSENPISCNTTGCAMGLAALLPEFQALGLKPVSYKTGAPQRIWDAYPKNEDYTDVELTMPDGRTHWGTDAASVLFDVGSAVADSLFMPDDYERTGAPTRGAAGELEVAKRLEYLAANGEDAFLTKYHISDDDEPVYDTDDDEVY